MASQDHSCAFYITAHRSGRALAASRHISRAVVLVPRLRRFFHTCTCLHTADVFAHRVPCHLSRKAAGKRAMHCHNGASSLVLSDSCLYVIITSSAMI